MFVLASGWRTGSTLVQRLLCSHPTIHVWGENRGLCDDLEGIYRTMWQHHSSSARAEWEFHVNGTDGWIANLSPSADAMSHGIRALLECYLARPVRAMGKERWGFKEVRHTLDTARFLRSLYPDAQFIGLVRHPRDCLASARATQRTWRLLDQVAGPESFLTHWQKIARSFLDAREIDRIRVMRYEDLLSNPGTVIADVARFLTVDADAFRSDVLSTRRRGWSEDAPYLTDDDRTALASPALWKLAAEYGYREES